MLFNSHVFIFLFLPVCIAGFYLFYRPQKNSWIVWVNLCSVVFYGYWSLWHLCVFLFSIGFNFLISHKVAQKNKPALWIALIFNLGLLGYFKYTNFLIDQINMISGDHIGMLNIVLPIGISFFTFQQIAYQVDAYQGKAPAISFSKYFFFVSFFPQLIAGPIVHHSEIFSQFARHKRHLLNLAVGLSIFGIGLFKKVVLADSIAIPSNEVFGYVQAGGSPTLIEAWSGALAYSLQIYFDFSAYSDMAIGLARIFGLRLPQNFSSPYKAVSIIDFWRRWHITLSRFLRDYLYIPLGGNKKGAVRRYTNLMLTMLIGGFWHGASWNFVFWGGLHGLYLVANQFIKQCVPFKIPVILCWLVTMLCVVFAWVPFRADTLESTFEIWRGMIGLNGVELPAQLAFLGLDTADKLRGLSPVTLAQMAIMIGVCIFAPNVSQIFSRYNPTLVTPGYPATALKTSPVYWRPTLFWAAALAVALLIALMKLNDPSEFLYFQF